MTQLLVEVPQDFITVLEKLKKLILLNNELLQEHTSQESWSYWSTFLSTPNKCKLLSLIPTKDVEPQGCEGALGCTPCLSVPIACCARCRVGSPCGKEQQIFWIWWLSIAVHVLVVQRIGHLLGFASFPPQHTAGRGSQPSVPSRLSAGRWDSPLHLFCIILGSSFSEKTISVRNRDPRAFVVS